MRKNTDYIEQYRVEGLSDENDGFNGFFSIPVSDLEALQVVSSCGFGWDHVSVATPGREVTNEEMARVRDLFWPHDAPAVVEYHDAPDGTSGIAVGVSARHLWSPQLSDIIRPPSRIFSTFLVSDEEADQGVAYRKVQSSNLAEIKYDADERTLFVVFTNGGHYAYDNVSIDLYDGLMDAESVGKFFHKNIRNSHDARQIEEKQDE